MSPDQFSRHPGFLPYGPLRNALLGLPARDWIDHCNVLARRRGLCSAAGMPISFSMGGGSIPGALRYETSILREGRIECRGVGRGALHDLHNALVWLTFPRIKATLNQLHLDSALKADHNADHNADQNQNHSADRRVPGRGRVRDAVTLLDESGLLWLSGSRRLDEQLLARNWRSLLVSNRDRVQAEVLPIIIGHGLLEKLAAPYKAMTAHCLVCPWPAPPGPGSASPAQANPPARAGASDFAGIDSAVAARIGDAFTAAAPILAPLPILGLPGWDPANFDPSYYDDARVFRAQKN